VRSRYADLVDEVRELSGAPDEELWRFFASGMMLNVISTIDLGKADRDWAPAWVDPKTLLDPPEC